MLITGEKLLSFPQDCLRGGVFCNCSCGVGRRNGNGKATTGTTAMWWLGEGGGREADFSAAPFANARTASVEMTIL
jgi:hypothetical protein